MNKDNNLDDEFGKRFPCGWFSLRTPEDIRKQIKSFISELLEKEREEAYKEGWDAGATDEANDCYTHVLKERERIIKIVEGMRTKAYPNSDDTFEGNLISKALTQAYRKALSDIIKVINQL